MIITCIQRLVEPRRWRAIIVVLVLTSFSVAGQVPAPAPTTQPAKTGTIKGTVVNENGQPLHNVRISISTIGSINEGHATSTDREGNFELNGLAPVNYRVVPWRSTYTPVLDDTQPNIYRVGDFVRLVMMKGGVITGTVTSQTGEPVVGVRVRAKPIADNDRQPFPYRRFVPERMTDDRGVYRIYGLPAGTYVVWAGGPGGWSYSGLDPFDADVPTYSPDSTRDTAQEIIVRPGVETSNVDIRYRGEPGRLVSGRASGPASERPVGFGISLTSTADRDSSWSAMTIQSPDGKGFVFRGVDDGDYDVTAVSFREDGGWAILPEPKRITVRGADVTGLELVTQPLSSVSGRVVLEDSKAKECTDKRPPLFSETIVSALRHKNEAWKLHPQFMIHFELPATADAQGNVMLKNMAPGRYYFLPQFSGKYWYLHSISLAPLATPAPKTTKPVDAARTWTTLKPGDRLSGLTITLAQGAASLRGQLALAEGETVPEKLFVYLVPAERERADDVLRFYAAAVAPDGKIALNNLAPGRYWILVQPAIESPLTKLRLPDETETRLRLRRAAEAGKTEIEFKPCQNVVDFRVRL